MMIYHHKSLDNSLLNFHKNFQPDLTKTGRVMAKKRKEQLAIEEYFDL